MEMIFFFIFRQILVQCVAQTNSAFCFWVQTESYLKSVDWIKESNIKSKWVVIVKKINKIDTVLTHVWLFPVKIATECPGEKQMISDGHPGFFLFEKPRSNRLTLVST